MIVRTLYDDVVRKEIKNGDIAFIRKNTAVARIITFVTRTRFSHVGILFRACIEGEERLFIVEAQGGSRRRILNFSFYSNSKDIEIVEAPKPWSTVKDKALERLGLVKYGWVDAVYVGFREFLNSYAGIVVPSRDFPGETCSEFVARVYGLENKSISPGKQFTSLLEAGNRIRVMLRP